MKLYDRHISANELDVLRSRGKAKGEVPETAASWIAARQTNLSQDI